MKSRRMATITLDPTFSLQINTKSSNPHGSVIEEIEGLIKVHKDGHVERTQIVPCVTSALAPELNVTSKDIVIDRYTNIWARFYVPKCHGKLPLLVYFHGGGFAVGSAAWSCYHEFLARLAAYAGCVIMSVNYRLAPENPLPAAYDDGLKALLLVRQQALCGTNNNEWWSKNCNFSSVYLAGDSAGANIAYNLELRLNSKATCQEMALRPLGLKGLILIQPFFGGESRTHSEKFLVQHPRSALTLAASDTYWRLSLPKGSTRDHPWCNPGVKLMEGLTLLPIMVCISEKDILKDRNLEFCGALGRAGKKVKCVMYNGVGHAFQILDKSQISQTRIQEMVSNIKSFITT